jgi:transposase
MRGVKPAHDAEENVMAGLDPAICRLPRTLHHRHSGESRKSSFLLQAPEAGPRLSSGVTI